MAPITKSIAKLFKPNGASTERLVAQISAELQPLEQRQHEIEQELLSGDLLLRVYVGEEDALARQADLKREHAELPEKIGTLKNTLAAAQAKVQLETAARIAAKKKAEIEAHCAKRQAQVAAVREFQDLAVKLEAVRNRIFDIGEDLVNSHTAIAGSFPGPGLMTAAGELTKLISHEFFRISHAEFLGGNPLAKAPRPSLPGSKAPDGVSGAVPNKEQRDAGTPIQKWMPTITETLEQVAVWERDLLEGRRRYDGKPVGGATDETPPDPALWPVRGPSVAAAVEVQRAAPHIEGLPATSSDDGLADILGPAPQPASVAPPKPGKGSFKVGGVVIESSVDDGDPYTLEQIEAYQRERLKNAPRGFAAPAPKRRLS